MRMLIEGGGEDRERETGETQPRKREAATARAHLLHSQNIDVEDDDRSSIDGVDQ